MKLRTLVWREVFERKNQLATSFLAILLGITAIVSVKNVSFFSEKAVAKELDTLGANILILPKSTTVEDYYSADMQDETFPEEYAGRLATSDLRGLDNLSPKLSIPTEIQGKTYTLTGILPKNEFQAKAAWQGAGIFARPEGCGVVVNAPGVMMPEAQETLVRRRVIETLGANEVLVGADVAVALGVAEGDSLSVHDKTFSVIGILPETGTVDDSRIFGHLHTVQAIAGLGPVVNAIEVVGCCSEISKGLVSKINALLPDAKVVTVTQIVDTQIKTNRMMAQLSILFVGIVILVGGAAIANYMYANVFERRREIGTLMALGASSSLIVRLFLVKALCLGVAGGAAGFVLGTVLAVTLGPRLAGVPVLPMPVLLAWALGLSSLVAVLASYLPARRAARLDPSVALREV